MIELENQHLLVRIRPERGGRIDGIQDVATDDDWLWHPEDAHDEAREFDLGESFDDHWGGGFEEVFPNDAPGTLGGRVLPDHGELWRREWLVGEIGPSRVVLHFDCVTVPIHVVKLIELDSGVPRLKIRYAFRNRSPEPVPYLFKLHPALRIEPGDRFLFPPARTRPVHLGFSQRLGIDADTPYPEGLGRFGEPVRVDQALPPNRATREFLYVTHLSEGWCALARARNGRALRFRFSLEDFPCVWLFQSFGGFRGHYVAMLEPATGFPYDLEEAIRAKTCDQLSPRSTRFHAVEIEMLDMVALPDERHRQSDVRLPPPKHSQARLERNAS